MKKVIGIVGSPRAKGNSNAVVEAVLNGAKDTGAEVKIFHLNDMNIRSCQSCMYCCKHDTCFIKDDIQKLYEDIEEMNVIVIESQISKLLKTMIDRSYPLTDKNHKPRFGEKKLVMIFSQASPFFISFKTYIRYTKKILKDIGFKHCKDIIVAKCFEGDSTIQDFKILKKAYKIGKSLV